MDKSHPEPIEDNDKHETIKEAENNTEHSTVSDKSEAEQSQQPKPYFATGANQANTSKDKHDDVTVKQDKDESKDHHSGKKGAAIGAGTAGVAGAAGAMGVSKAKKHSNDAQNKSNSGKVNNSTEDKASEDKSKEHHNGKKVQQSVLEQQVWLEAQQVIVLLPLQNHMPLIMQVKTMMNMTIMTEIKNVKKVAWPKYCYH